MGTLGVKGLRDRSYGLPQMRIGNESYRYYSGTGGNKTNFTASRKTGAIATGFGSCIFELGILSPASIHGQGVFFCPVLSGYYGFALVCLPGLKDCEDQQGVPVCSRATISADFGRKVPISPCFRLDASDQFSYH
jgi:hypothetical protein